MSDKFVTVSTFYQSFVAQMAKNLLENEGIESMLIGELTSDGGFGAALGDQILLQVHEDDAQRAASILAVAEASNLNEDWEEQAESGAGVWICSICGEPVSDNLSKCYSCETPRESIRSSLPRDQTAIQSDPSTLPSGEEVQIRDEITRTPSSPPTSTPPTPMLSESDENETPAPTADGDDLARRACIACLFFVLMPLSWYYLARLMIHSGELSPKGLRYFYGALAINGVFVLLVLLFCAGGLLR